MHWPSLLPEDCTNTKSKQVDIVTPSNPREEALILHQEAHVPIGPLCGPGELEKFAAAQLDYTLVVVNAERCYECFAYGHGPTHSGLLYADGHYDAITTLKGFFRTSYFCARSFTPYHHQGHHACTNNPDWCTRCKQQGCVDFLQARRDRQLYPSVPCVNIYTY